MTMLMACAPSAASAGRLSSYWEGCRVAVIGLGRSGFAAAKLLCERGARVRVTDARETDTLCRAREALYELGAEAVELGGHTPQMLNQVDCLVASPGVPESTEPMRWAVQHHLPILSEIELAFQCCPSPVVAVTGTNGKSTVVTLIAEILTASGRPAVACGNVGIPFASVISELTPQSVAVVEVSSFQLLWCDQFRPHIGVLLNIGSNHLDRHHDQQAYVSAKARLLQRQTPDDWAVLNGRDPRIVELAEALHAQCAWFGENRSNPPALQLAPETQRALTDGAQAVLQVARLLGVPDPLSWQIMRSFRGLEHRLERVATVRGVHFVNDSKSTTPDSLLYALSQVQGDVVAIVGGRDKGMDFVPLAQRLHDERVKGVVLIGESRARLRPLLNGSSTVRESQTLENAVRAAFALAHSGATVLFSPACASFDMFRDFEERGRVFKTVVARLADAAS